MMTSLFSSFDPTSMTFQMNWILMFSTMIILPTNFWMKNSRWTMIKNKIIYKMNNEMKNITSHKEILIFSLSTFIIILTNNFMGLLPYNFTSPSHISWTMSLAIPMWMSIIIYSWMKFTNIMFAHLLPSGTPKMIMPMMIIIETTGIIIRPISLSVRLMANMIAGHLLMTLTGSNNSIEIISLTMPIQMILMTFESAISIIQAYVFATLINLYSSETP
nr:ATP synthase F0 subunit 6 [Tropiduchidae sp. 2 WQW-2023a]